MRCSSGEVGNGTPAQIYQRKHLPNGYWTTSICANITMCFPHTNALPSFLPRRSWPQFFSLCLTPPFLVSVCIVQCSKNTLVHIVSYRIAMKETQIPNEKWTNVKYKRRTEEVQRISWIVTWNGSNVTWNTDRKRMPKEKLPPFWNVYIPMANAYKHVCMPCSIDTTTSSSSTPPPIYRRTHFVKTSTKYTL